MLILLIILAILVVVLLIAVTNLVRKVEKYEDVTLAQVEHLQNISNFIQDADKHLKDLDNRGVFQSDDEVGFFFNQLMNIQKELNTYMLPSNYGEKESKQ